MTNADQLKEAQNQAYDAMYAAWNKAMAQFEFKDYEKAQKDPEYIEACQTYANTVTALEAALGPDAHCNAVDTNLWSLYSDFYKSEMGFRPKHHATRQEVLKALGAQPASVSN